MTKRSFVLLGVLLVGVASEARYYLGQESLLENEEELAVDWLEDSVEPVRRRFNEGVDRWRILALVSPMAPTSVGGLHGLYGDLLEPSPSLPIEVTVVFYPGLPWDSGRSSRTQPQWSQEKRWRFFWDPQDRVSRSLYGETSSASALLEGRYLLFRPQATWPRGGKLPEPERELSGRAATTIRSGGSFSQQLAELREWLEHKIERAPSAGFHKRFMDTLQPRAVLALSGTEEASP